jgi:hypothetical protein
MRFRVRLGLGTLLEQGWPCPLILRATFPVFCPACNGAQWSRGKNGKDGGDGTRNIPGSCPDSNQESWFQLCRY